MFRSRVVLAVASVLTVFPAAAFAGEHSNPRAMDCEGMTMAQSGSGPVLSEYRITSVNPYFQEQTNLKRTWKEQRGALVRVEARPGLTAQWLQLRLDRELAAVQANSGATPESPLAVAGARATVSSAPDGFVVTVAAPDRASGEQVLERAKALGARQSR
jgi:hypothetical protein